MSQGYKYFVIPYTAVPDDPAYKVWYASWSLTRPIIEPGVEEPMVVGFTTDELPEGATLVGCSVKDPPVPPPPPPALDANDLTSYQRSFETWSLARRSF